MTLFQAFMAGDVVGFVSAGAVYLAWPSVVSVVRQVKMLFGRARFVADCDQLPSREVVLERSIAQFQAMIDARVAKRKLTEPNQSSFVRKLQKHIKFLREEQLRLASALRGETANG